MAHYRQRWVALLVLLLAPAAATADPPEQADAPKPPPDPRAVEVRFLDDSVLRVRLADDPIEIATKHGKLAVPADQIKRLYFAQRIDPKTRRQIDQAIADLADPSTAQAARDRLLELNERAYPALQRAAKGQDPRRAEAATDLLARLEEADNARLATLRGTDLIETADGKIVGRLTADTLRIETKQFGELTMKLADARSLRSQRLIKQEPEPEPDEVLPDPGNMKSFEGMIGKTFRIRVTGNNASCWGTDVYTTDSPLSATAVHAGVLTLGETGIVEVEVVAPPPNFAGSNRNGVTTDSWGSYPGAYKFIKPKPRGRRE